MARKVGAAPRRKAAADAPPTPARELRGTKLSSNKTISNTGKWAQVVALFSRALHLKRQMGAHVHTQAPRLLWDAYALKKESTQFASPDLNAWERQAMYHDVVSDYQRKLAQQVSRATFKIGRGWSYSVYQRQTTLSARAGRAARVFNKGDFKPGSFQLKMASTPLTRCATYLLRVNIPEFDPASLSDTVGKGDKEKPNTLKLELLRLQAKPELWRRLLALAARRQSKLAQRLRPIDYVSSTFRVCPAESHTTVVVDKSNGKFQLFLKLRLGLKKREDGFAYLPLLSSKKRLQVIVGGDVTKLGFGKEFRLKYTSGRKLHVCTTFEAPEPDFLAEGVVLGLDLNTKRSFANDDTGGAYHLSQVVLGAGVALLSKIDAQGGVSQMNYRRAAQLRQWTRRNEAHIKALLATWCDAWRAKGITDIWLEDLAMSGDATFIRHDVLDEKYSRVLRLMRLSGVKDWLLSIGEKRGLRVHTTNPAYTSQECNRCHHIDKANRTTQALFHCVNCHSECDADTGAAINIRERSRSALKSLLHELDRFGRCSPKPMTRPKLKALLIAEAALAETVAGGVSDLPTPEKTNK